MPVNGRRPVTELAEVIQNELVREAASGEEAKYFGMVNQVYSNDLPSVLPEIHIKKEAFVTLVSNYTTGTVTIGTGTSNIKGASTSWTSANSDGRLINITGTDVIYRVTFDVSTSLTFQDSLTWTGASGSGLAYNLISDRYSLPSDFGYMLEDDQENPHVVYRYSGGQKTFLQPYTEEEMENNFTPTAGSPYAYCVKWIKENPYLYITLASNTSDILAFSYVPQLTTLSEYTTGTATFSTTTAVTADSGTTTWSTTITTGTNTYYIRNDADGTGSASKWIKISSVGGTSALTLASAWNFTSGTGQTYTISEISKWPTRFDDAILYKAAYIIDPDNVQAPKWQQLYSDAIGMDRRTESRRDQTSKLRGFPGQR